MRPGESQKGDNGSADKSMALMLRHRPSPIDIALEHGRAKVNGMNREGNASGNHCLAMEILEGIVRTVSRGVSAKQECVLRYPGRCT